ncbi:MAG: DUF58 domain-containing protein [Candidatus Hydrogenedentes bacterium]|nr:DUF58 domain-containing protein [Candidatus Hydrogenedentota bacterium]
MMAPADRLIVWAGVIGLSISIAAAAMPGLVWPGVALAAVFAAIAAADALASRRRLRDVKVSAPALTRITKGQPGALSLEVAGAFRLPSLTLGFALPPEFVTSPERAQLVPARDCEHQQVMWPCTGIKRGRVQVDRVYLEAPSKLRLWLCRCEADLATEIRIYPNLVRERNRLAGYFLNRGAPGLHAQRLIGKGRELEKLRDYVPGDLYEDVYWKATARRGRPISKVYQVERTQEVYVLIDCSRLSARIADHATPTAGSTENPASHLERYITSALILGLVAERQGDFFGVLAFDDQVRSFVRARSGSNHYAMCRDALFGLQPNLVNPDFSNLFSFIRMRLRRRALLVILTDLDDPLLSEQFVQNLRILQGHHLVQVSLLKPPTVGPLFSQPDATSADAVYDRLAGHIQWRLLRELRHVLRRRGVNLALVDNEALTTQIVNQYLQIKQRQLL